MEDQNWRWKTTECFPRESCMPRFAITIFIAIIISISIWANRLSQTQLQNVDKRPNGTEIDFSWQSHFWMYSQRDFPIFLLAHYWVHVLKSFSVLLQKFQYHQNQLFLNIYHNMTWDYKGRKLWVTVQSRYWDIYKKKKWWL